MTAGFSETEILRPFIRNLLLWSPHYYTVICSLSSSFQWSQNVDLEWLLNVIQGVFARCARVDKVAVFSIRKRSVKWCALLPTCCKIRHVSKLTTASRGSPCDSAAFLYTKMNILDRRSDDYVDKVESLSFLDRLDTDEFHVICLPASFRIVSRLQHNRYGAELRRSSVCCIGSERW